MKWLNWCDIAIGFILFYSAFKGYYTGLLKSLTKLIAIIMGLMVAMNFHNALTDYFIVVWGLDKKLSFIIEPFLDLFIPSLPLMKNLLLQNNKVDGVNILTQALLNGISFIFLLVVTNALIKFVGYFISSIFELTLLGPLNHLGGALFGLVRGLVLVGLIILFLMPFQVPASLLGEKTFLLKSMENSYLAKEIWQVIVSNDWNSIANWV